MSRPRVSASRAWHHECVAKVAPRWMDYRMQAGDEAVNGNPTLRIGERHAPSKRSRKSPKRFSLLTFVLIGGAGRRTSERARRAKYPRRPRRVASERAQRAKYPRRPRRVASERACSSVPHRGTPRGGTRARAAALRLSRPHHRMPNPRLHPLRARSPTCAASLARATSLLSAPSPTQASSPSSTASTARKSAAHVFPHPSTIRRAAAS